MFAEKTMPWKFKTFNGQLYTGVQIGRGDHWTYDAGDWKETKITPDLWEISYAVTKRRVGHVGGRWI